MGITEEGSKIDAVEFGVVRELGSVVEGHGFAEGCRKWFVQVNEGLSGGRCGSVFWSCGPEDTGVSVVEGKNGLAGL